MWRHTSTRFTAEYLKPWSHSVHDVTVKWSGQPPTQGSVARIIPGSGRTAMVCAPDLAPLGTAQLPFDPHGASLEGHVSSGARAQIRYFGET
jgi:hypothetical protein